MLNVGLGVTALKGIWSAVLRWLSYQVFIPRTFVPSSLFEEVGQMIMADFYETVFSEATNY